MTKKELLSWIESQQNQGYSVPMLIRGGGQGYISPDDNAKEIIFDEDYLDIETITEEDEDFDWIKERFESILGSEEMSEMTILRLNHDTGWNEENFDLMLCVWND